MSILKKVKNLVTGDEVTAEKPVAKKPRAKKAVAAVAEHEDHKHENHEGHDHAAHAPSQASKQDRPQSVAGAVGFAAANHIVRGLITEKGTIASQFNTYLFQVAIASNKSSIKQAIEKLYGVKVTKVHTMRQDGKVVRYGRIEGRRSNFKKAYVTVAKGQTITIHKGV